MHLRDKAGWTPLHFPSGKRTSRRRALVQLVYHSADMNAKQQHLWVPLRLASRDGHFDSVRLLLDRGANVDGRNVDGRTTCQLASMVREWEIVGLFSEYGECGD